MNSYPFSVSGLLLPPPPPPSPPPPSILPVVRHAPTEQQHIDCKSVPGTEMNTCQMPSFNQYHQENSTSVIQQSTVMHLPSMIPSPSVNSIHLLSANNSSGGMMILPASHLRLPPPPPPPPISPTPPSELNSSRTYNNTRNANFIHNSSQKSFQRGKLHMYRSGPNIWASHKQFPSGLQGPWKAPDSEDVEQAVNTTALLTMGSSIESAFPADSGSEGNHTSTQMPVVPKLTPSSTTYKEHKVDPKDPRLPKELTNLFEALSCKLCEVVSSSTVQARHHYSGKPHEKKVRQWLQRWSEETGLPAPKRQKLDTAIDINPEDLYCKVCEVTFTSVKHGEQHKMGKPHQKAVRLGYSTSKTKNKKLGVPLDPTGRFGIGESFQKEAPKESAEVVQSESHQNIGLISTVPAPKNSSVLNKFFCDLCQVSTTSQEHLDSHYAGAKHRKALVNAARSGIKPELSVVPPPVEPAESILASVIGHNDVGFSRTKNVSNDLSIYRTPSGIN